MSRSRDRFDLDHGDAGFPSFIDNRWKYRAIALLGGVAVLLIALVIVWNMFVVYVPPNQMLVITAKNGEPLPEGYVVAKEGQKGVQKKVLGEGYHFIVPIAYETELRDNYEIPPDKIGVVTNLGGQTPPEGRILVDNDEEKGIRRKVLPPGRHRLNPYAVKVDIEDATRINPGYVGVLRRLLGKESTSRFAQNDEEKGILRQVLQPGLYYINPKEYEVIHAEVGIYQTTFHYSENSRESSPGDFPAITFPVKDGNTIRMDCTIEWEMLPRDTPDLAALFGTRREGNRTLVDIQAIVRNLIKVRAEKISRDRGFNYRAQDFLEGEQREQFQKDFTDELERVCMEKQVQVRSAFIRRIVIPEDFLKEKRAKQVAVETRLTNEKRELTADAKAAKKEAEKAVDVAVAQVEAETARLVAGIDQDAANIELKADADVEKLTKEYEAKIALLDAEKTRVLGTAEAESKKLKETATAEIFKMKMEVFQDRPDAYLRYVMAQELNPKMVLRLFHSGPGTLWTNMGQKDMNFLMPVPGGSAPANPAPAEKAVQK
jgi:hypothetical protein